MSAQLAASLPDPGEASFVPIAAVIGGLAGSCLARIRNLEREDIRRWAEDGAFIGGLVGLAIYLGALVASV